MYIYYHHINCKLRNYCNILIITKMCLSLNHNIWFFNLTFNQLQDYSQNHEHLYCLVNWSDKNFIDAKQKDYSTSLLKNGDKNTWLFWFLYWTNHLTDLFIDNSFNKPWYIFPMVKPQIGTIGLTYCLKTCWHSCEPSQDPIIYQHL